MNLVLKRCISLVLIIMTSMLYISVTAQSLQSPSYYNQLFLAFIKARAEYKLHDATILKTLLMAQEHPNVKAKLAKFCKELIETEKITDK